MDLLAQGAEAKVMKEKDSILKERFSKQYRLPQLDQSLRQFRTRREAKVLQRLEGMDFPAPHLREFSDTRMSIVMDFVPGEKLRDLLPMARDSGVLAQEIGKRVGQLHRGNIIHGDLTTSNMIYNDLGLHFIDFGLSSFSEKVEDKAVDLFLLDRSLESKHYHLYPDIFEQVLEGYKENYPEYKEVLQRFEQVKRRGRNKGK